MTFKKAVGKLHLWLGLSSGLVVFIVALTGCIYVFQKEISETIKHNVFFVNPASQVLPLSLLSQKATASLSSAKPLNFITTYRQPDRAWEFAAYKAGNKDAISYFDALAYYDVVYIDPHTGRITGQIDYKYEFFNVIKNLHWSLLLNTPYGQPIVGYATLIFFVMLITGIVLWWPKKWNRANINKSFKIKWEAGFKRVNYDLHNVSGFYVLLFAAIISLTGMVWAIGWVQKAVYAIAACSITPPPAPPVFKSTVIPVTPASPPIDCCFSQAMQTFTTAQRISVELPAGADDVLSIQGYKGKETYYDYDELLFDQYSARPLHRTGFATKNRGEKLIGMNYDIHVGAILGLPGKIIAFVASLIAACLPVTGTLVWIGRKRKKKYVRPARSR